MKKIIFFTFFIFASIHVNGQNKYAKKIAKCAKEVSLGLKTFDAEITLKYTYPKEYIYRGSKEKTLEEFKKVMTEMQNQNLIIHDASFNKPEKIYKAGNELHCLITHNLVMELDGIIIKSTGYYLLISKDKGKFWYFMDTGNLSPEVIQLFFPEFNENLIIPEPTEPIIETK